MTIAAEFGSGQVLWSILWFSLFVLWVWLVITVFSDIIRARDMSGWAKAMWSLAVLIVPLIGTVLYLIVNGDSMNRRDEDEARAAMAAVAQGRADAGQQPELAGELDRLARLHETGALDDAEYDRAKSRAVSAS